MPSQLVLDELPKKLKNEKKTKNDFKDLFSLMSDEFLAFYILNGTMIDFRKFLPDVTALLKRSHNRTSQDFKFTARDRFNIDRTIESANINTALSRYFEEHANRNANYIIDTTRKEATDAVFRTTREAEQEGRSLDQDELALGASRAFSTRSITRSGTIAQYEVQDAAESSKFFEASLLATAAFLPVRKNTWEAILDRRTRPAHANADGQEVTVGQPFAVGGESLRWPGDTGLGASLENTLNCRCSVQLIDD